jgi:hypothetical protein
MNQTLSLLSWSRERRPRVPSQVTFFVFWLGVEKTENYKELKETYLQAEWGCSNACFGLRSGDIHIEIASTARKKNNARRKHTKTL